jgi:hypothetical protein
MMDVQKRYGDVPPDQLFADWTTVHDLEEKRKLMQHCMAFGYLPIIDYDEEYGCYIWHTLISLKLSRKWCKPIASRYQRPSRVEKERQLTAVIEDQLRHQGVVAIRGVQCAVGVADLVTPKHDMIFEVKPRLSRAALFTAVGQVLLYRQCLNPMAQAVIAGSFTDDVEVMRRYIEALGIELLCIST